MKELEAFVAECKVIERTLADITGAQWDEPALGVWNMAQLVAHVVRGAGRIAAYLPQPVEGPAQVDRVSYFAGTADMADEVAQRAITEASDVDPMTLPERFTQQWRASADAARGESPDRITATIKGTMRLDDYISTRVLEMVVHHTDICRALARPPVSDPAAAQLTAELLEGLLGESKPRNLGRARFIAVATGRTPSDDPRFPVLS